EVLAAGCPVVISDQVNICHEVSAEKVGAVVPTQVVPLAEELNRWLTNGELRRSAAERGPAFVRREYDWNQIARRWVKRYEELRTPERSFYAAGAAGAEPAPAADRLRVLHVIANPDYETG